MKIKSMKFVEHPILNTVVLVGTNGSGKTTILDYIAEKLRENINVHSDIEYFENSKKILE